jgi:hypothetical protein
MLLVTFKGHLLQRARDFDSVASLQTAVGLLSWLQRAGSCCGGLGARGRREALLGFAGAADAEKPVVSGASSRDHDRGF